MKKICYEEIISKNLKKSYKVLWDSYNKTTWIIINGGELQVGSNCQTEESAIKTAQMQHDSKTFLGILKLF